MCGIYNTRFLLLILYQSLPSQPEWICTVTGTNHNNIQFAMQMSLSGNSVCDLLLQIVASLGCEHTYTDKRGPTERSRHPHPADINVRHGHGREVGLLMWTFQLCARPLLQGGISCLMHQHLCACVCTSSDSLNWGIYLCYCSVPFALSGCTADVSSVLLNSVM